jgi:hypothetical protein
VQGILAPKFGPLVFRMKQDTIFFIKTGVTKQEYSDHIHAPDFKLDHYLDISFSGIHPTSSPRDTESYFPGGKAAGA